MGGQWKIRHMVVKEAVAIFRSYYDPDRSGEKWAFVARFVPTWGGGSPPAPRGQSGSMKLR